MQQLTRDFNGITVTFPSCLTAEEVIDICVEEYRRFRGQKKEICAIEITVDGDELVVKTTEKSPIKRIRRITGYLSELTSFNPAKQAEAAAREAHVQGGHNGRLL